MLAGEKSYLCHEEKKRCPLCGSLKTKKNGHIKSEQISQRGTVKRKIQRYFCNERGKSFTSIGHNVRGKVSYNLKTKIVIEYVCEKSSLGEVANRYGISKTSILNWFEDASEKLQYIPMVKNLKINWSGLIQIDGKEIKVKNGLF